MIKMIFSQQNMRNGKVSEYIRVATIRKKYDISDTKLRSWANSQLVRIVKTPGGNRLYHAGDIESLFGQEETEKRRRICYCRVSSQHQKEDLKRQVELLKNRFPEEEIIQDIGSGINYKKPGLQKLLGLVIENKVASITVVDKDRLCRFGFELFEQICRHYKTEILVLFPVSADGERELADDLLTIANVFVARKNGQRAARNRKERAKDAEEGQGQSAPGQRDQEV